MSSPVDVALTLLGIQEATGHNDGVPADLFMRGDKLAWCAGFILYCYHESSWRSLYASTRSYYKLRSVQAMEDEMKKRGVWFGARLVDMIEPGDIVFHRNRAGSDSGRGRHVGMVSRGTGGVIGTSFETIDGNFGDTVATREMSVVARSISGFARPRLAAVSA